MIAIRRPLILILVLTICFTLVSAGCRQAELQSTQPSQESRAEPHSAVQSGAQSIVQSEVQPSFQSEPQTTAQIESQSSIQTEAQSDATQPASQSNPQKIDRYDQVFDTSDDKGKLTVRFLKLVSTDLDSKGSHVKSGDSSIIISPDGLVMVIDSGAPSCGNQIVQYLKTLDITKIDIFVASHMHVDHLGGFPDLAKEFKIGLVYMNKVEYPTSKTYKDFMSAVRNYEIPFKYLAEGDKFNFGKKVHITVYNPPIKFEYPENYPSDCEEFQNNMSIMMRFKYGESTMLFAGDIYSAAEKRILNKYKNTIHSDIVKGNHHGANTSNTFDWVTAVKPKLTVFMHEGISSELIYKRYKMNEAMVYITSVDGSVKVSANDKRDYTWITQFDRQSDILD